MPQLSKDWSAQNYTSATDAAPSVLSGIHHRPIPLFAKTVP
jgi:hypothetical protein